MIIEAEAIPYESARLRGERLLVLAPHPDDETIGCGGLVAQHLRENRQVRVVVATDGAAANAESADRAEESRRGLAVLGGASGSKADLVFLGFPDRGLAEACAPLLREQLLDFRPDLILVPSPIEIHPDHYALSRAFCELIQRDESLSAALALSRVAFYEVGQPLRPNALVDITEVADLKFAAIAEHRSQTTIRDYTAYARGLNAYRAMTLPPSTLYAEAYYVLALTALRTTPWSGLRRLTGTPPDIEPVAETLPISVIIRTKDRPALLREALESVRATGYPCEIVVVNDGGSRPEIDGVRLVNHEQSRGRSIAANEGVRAATHAFVAFLDDDDLFYPEHLQTLARAATTSHAAWYTDAVSVSMRRGASGANEPHERLRQYATDFDRELLLVDNYIPLPTLLIPRASFLDAGGFDPAFDLFEDWDFLIRLAQRGDFQRVPRVTVEVRHFEGGSSIILETREASERFVSAKLQVWQKHEALVTPAVFARVLESQKHRLGSALSDATDARGRAEHKTLDVLRLEREKAELIAQLQDFHHSVNAHILRIRELETAVETTTASLVRTESRLDAVTRENQELAVANLQTHQALQSARIEIERLNGLLHVIYGSRTWKLHTLAEKLRGRG